MGNNPNPKHELLQLSLLFIVTTFLLSFTNANSIHFSSHLLPYTTLLPPSPTHAPAPSPHHHHHRTNHRVNHHPAAPSPAPSLPHHSKPVVSASPPAQAPSTHPPVYPPVQAGPVPVQKRKFVAVQGMVYCKKNCSSYSGVYNTLLGASPLPGARVVLRCRNTAYLLRKTATTDSKGYFFLEAPPHVTTYGAHKCKVYLAHRHLSSGPGGPASPTCSSPTDMNYGATGAYLYSNNTGQPSPLPSFSLFSVGPFAYESDKCVKQGV